MNSQNTSLTIFEQIKKKDTHHNDYWSARDLAKILDYSEYRHFIPVIEKAKESCKNAGQSIKKHFDDILDMIEVGKTASRSLPNIRLSRYACYLIMQNADPSKEVVAIEQTYFAVQTRRQELQDQLVEDQKRVSLRDDLTAHNKRLVQSASKAGVQNFASFINFGYRGLYGGLNMEQIKRKKKIQKSQKILNHMGGEELGANIFRATQAEAKIRRENILGEAKASQAHFQVGQKVRKIIRELGGEMPEDLPPKDQISLARKRLKNAKIKTLKQLEVEQ